MAKEWSEDYCTVFDGQILTTSTGGPFRPGQVVVHRSGTNRAQVALAKWVLLDNNGCSQGEVLVRNLASTVESSVAKAATADEGGLPCGVAAATIASNKYGFAIISGYVEKADLSETAASGEYLMISGSTAGKLTPNKGSVYNLGTQGNASQFGVFAVARTAIATGVGSIQILGVWG